MSAFLNHFLPDPEEPDSRRIWRTAKPLMRDAVVAYAPFYPEYPRLKVSKSGATNAPSCPSAREASTEVDVVLYSDTHAFGDAQERAWSYILDHHQQIEASLRHKLFARHSRFLQQLHDEVLPEDKQVQKYWNTIQGEMKWDEPSAIDHLFKLVAIGLADSGLDECGFSSFEFQTGWDRDHGLGILMHRDRVLAADGMTELIQGSFRASSTAPNTFRSMTWTTVTSRCSTVSGRRAEPEVADAEPVAAPDRAHDTRLGT